MSVKINPNKFEIKIQTGMVKLFSILTLAIMLVLTIPNAEAQADSGIKQITTFHPDPIYNVNNPETYADRYYGSTPSFIGDSSGDARFLVFESNANIATYNPRNSDRNWEIFLMDVAQRHIFQITNTKNGVANINVSPSDPQNMRALIINKRPVISNNGKWIAFASNATTSTPQVPDNTNPGNFDANAPGAIPILQQDGNTEIWLYQIPNYTAVDLSSGDVPTFVDLAGGNFTRVTNTPPYFTPVYYPQA